MTNCKRNRLSSSHAALDPILRWVGSLAGCCEFTLSNPALPSVLVIGLFDDLLRHLEVADRQTTVDR
jgi:hypothetical protein